MYDEMKNEKNVCKVGQSNETTILAAMALTPTEGRREKAAVAVFLLLFGFFRNCNISAYTLTFNSVSYCIVGNLLKVTTIEPALAYIIEGDVKN
jgi:hypothetical protein